MIKKLKRYLVPDPVVGRAIRTLQDSVVCTAYPTPLTIERNARAECLRIVDELIDDCDIECWNYTAKRIRDKIAALDLISKAN